MSAPTALTLKDELRSPNILARIAEALPAHVTPERFTRSILFAAQKNPDILKCTRESLFKAVFEAAELGLDCSGGPLSEGALVSFNNRVKDGDKEHWEKQCQLMVMYRGFISLARRAGDFTMFDADVVYPNDHFVYEKGINPKLEHRPALTGRTNTKDITHAYAIARNKDGEVQFVVMTREEIERARSVSKSKDRGPWVDWWDAMARKTCILRLKNYIPLSSEKLRRAMELSAAEYVFEKESEHASSRYIEQRPGQSRTSALLDAAKNAEQPAAKEVEATPIEQEPTPPKKTEKAKGKGSSKTTPIKADDPRLATLEKAAKIVATAENIFPDDAFARLFEPAVDVKFYVDADDHDCEAKEAALVAAVATANKIIKDAESE